MTAGSIGFKTLNPKHPQTPKPQQVCANCESLNPKRHRLGFPSTFLCLNPVEASSEAWEARTNLGALLIAYVILGGSLL